VLLVGRRTIAADGSEGEANREPEVFDRLYKIRGEKNSTAESLINLGTDQFSKQEVLGDFHVLVVVGFAGLRIEEIVDIDEASGGFIGITYAVDVALGEHGIGLGLEADTGGEFEDRALAFFGTAILVGLFSFADINAAPMRSGLVAALEAGGTVVVRMTGVDALFLVAANALGTGDPAVAIDIGGAIVA